MAPVLGEKHQQQASSLTMIPMSVTTDTVGKMVIRGTKLFWLLFQRSQPFQHNMHTHKYFFFHSQGSFCVTQRCCSFFRGLGLETEIISQAGCPESHQKILILKISFCVPPFFLTASR